VSGSDFFGGCLGMVAGALLGYIVIGPLGALLGFLVFALITGLVVSSNDRRELQQASALTEACARANHVC
jgi:uncharacterized protein YqgC (DUF456 family)